MTMLDRMRRHKGWLKWSLALVVVAFVVFYIPDFLQQDTGVTSVGAAPREVVAEVGGQELTAGEFQQRYFAQVQAYRAQFGGSMNEQLLRQLGVEQQVLTQMIDQQVALIEAERHGLTVSDDELAQQIFSMPGLQENGQFIGEARYEQLLRSQQPPLTKERFEEELRRELLTNKLRSALTDWVAVSDADVDREYRLRNEKVKLQVVSLTADSFRDKVTLSDAEVATYFESHKAEYRVGEQRKVRYLLIDRDLARQKVAVPPSDIQRYYNDNLQQYQTPEQIRASHILLKTEGKDEAAVRKEAEGVLAQVQGGADFAALATKLSEDEGSKATGGDLDYFGRGRMVPEFDTAAFALQPGQTSDIVKSQFGFHIIRVTDRRPGITRTIDEARAQIQEQLAGQITDQQITTRARELNARINNPADLDTVAKELGAMVQESGLVKRGDPVPGLGAAPALVDAAFRQNIGEVSDFIMTARGPVFITMTERKDPYGPALDEVKDRVRQDAIRARAVDLSRERAVAIASTLKSAPNFATAATAQGLIAKDTALLTRGSALPDVGTSAEIDKAVFALPIGGVTDPIRTNAGTVIVKVAERDEVTPEELTRGREAFRLELLNERRGRFFSAYMAKAKTRVPIEIKSDVLDRILAAQRGV
jgi:peptidyl-prolyl cis-trans isomerase D